MVNNQKADYFGIQLRESDFTALTLIFSYLDSGIQQHKDHKENDIYFIGKYMFNQHIFLTSGGLNNSD